VEVCAAESLGYNENKRAASAWSPTLSNYKIGDMLLCIRSLKKTFLDVRSNLVLHDGDDDKQLVAKEEGTCTDFSPLRFALQVPSGTPCWEGSRVSSESFQGCWKYQWEVRGKRVNE
jgi:hypothetical protein